MPTKSLEDRFWSKVDRTTGCWLWMGWCFSNGYGEFRADGTNKRRHLLAHRVAYELSCGPIPERMFVLHHCDVRNCVNPSHLFLGTQRDNVQDCIDKGRQGNHAPHNPAKGEASYRSNLAEEQVVQIRSEYALGGISQAALGSRYGISQSAVLKIVKGINWKHLPVVDYGDRSRQSYHQVAGEQHGRHKLTAKQVQAIRDSADTHQRIAECFGVSRATISLIKAGKLWSTTNPIHEGTP